MIISSDSIYDTIFFLQGTRNNDYEYFIGCRKRKESSWCHCIMSSFLEIRKLRPREVKKVTLDLTGSLHTWLRPKLFPFLVPYNYPGIILRRWCVPNPGTQVHEPLFPFCSSLTCALFSNGPDYCPGAPQRAFPTGSCLRGPDSSLAMIASVNVLVCLCERCGYSSVMCKFARLQPLLLPHTLSAMAKE